MELEIITNGTNIIVKYTKIPQSIVSILAFGILVDYNFNLRLLLFM